MNGTAVPTYLEPQWFIPLFALMWLGVTGLLAHLSGWTSLARSYRAGAPSNGERFRFVSGSMGLRFLPVSYGSCLFVRVEKQGFHLSILLPFRFLTPPLFIPWSDVESAVESRFLLFRYTVLTVRSQWPRITIRGAAGTALSRTFQATNPTPPPSMRPKPSAAKPSLENNSSRG
jgi:hypothetical protein